MIDAYNGGLSAATPTTTGAYSSSTNRFTTTWAEHDAAGNLTHFKFPGNAALDWTAAYNGENKQRYYCAGDTNPCTSSNDDAEYVYDGEGNRVQKITPSAAVTYVYDAFGRLAAEYSTASSGMTPGSYFRTTDHLGSTRLVTDGAGGVHDRRDFFPFGEQIPASSTYSRDSASIAGYNDTDLASAHLFTGKERGDLTTEGGLDYFGARYYSGTLGRFTSVDPGSANAKLPLPQSWNGYAYVDNRPFRFVDPDGTQSQLAECAYECASISAGVVSLEQNFRAGNYIAATIDAGGVLLDSLALAAPGIPGIVGFAIQAARGGSKFFSGASDVSGGARRFFHGTDIESATRLLGGEGLDASTAAAKKIDGAPGFFLADDAAAAEFFGNRRDPGGVLQFDFSEAAMKQLSEAGATIGPVPPGKFSRPPGNELRITEDLFDLFNELRESGEITVTGVQ